jgi:hypothetical protein
MKLLVDWGASINCSPTAARIAAAPAVWVIPLWIRSKSLQSVDLVDMLASPLRGSGPV